MSLLPAATLRWRLEPDLLSLPRLGWTFLIGALTTVSGVAGGSLIKAGGSGGGGGGGGGSSGGERAAGRGGARCSNTSLWYFCT